MMMKPKPSRIIAIVQARMGSSRLPFKIMKPLAGRPMLERVVRRLRRTQTLHEIVVATTTNPADDDVAEFCSKNDWNFYRGNEHDLCDRYYQAAKLNQADTVVRVTSDCPFIDPVIVDQIVKFYLHHYPQYDYVSNNLPPRTFPIGLDAEIMSFDALAKAWKEDMNPAWREHATPYIYKTPDEFRIGAIRNDIDLSEARWTVDTPEDFTFASLIYDFFQSDRFSWRDVLELLDRHPEWNEINRHVKQKEI
jgi:spore coat polysaccharide biosynthesis protein SpsF